MSLYVIRDRESGHYYSGALDSCEPELGDLTSTFGDEDAARTIADTLPLAADVLELRPYTGAVEHEYLRYVHAALSHRMLRADEPAAECPISTCAQLRERLGL